MSYRVLIVDRRVLFATGLARLLSRRPAISQAQALLDRSSLTDALRDCWDVAVVGRQDFSEVLAHHAAGTRVVVLLDSADEAVAAAMLSGGASGICVPGDSASDVAEVIERVAAGEMRVPATLVGPVLQTLMAAGDRAAEVSQVLGQLTPRERVVLALLGGGMGRAEIARRMALSPNTVRTHIQHLLRKLSLHSQLEAAAYAREVMAAAHVDLRADGSQLDNLVDLDAHASRFDGGRRI